MSYRRAILAIGLAIATLLAISTSAAAAGPDGVQANAAPRPNQTDATRQPSQPKVAPAMGLPRSATLPDPAANNKPARQLIPAAPTPPVQTASQSEQPVLSPPLLQDGAATRLAGAQQASVAARAIGPATRQRNAPGQITETRSLQRHGPNLSDVTAGPDPPRALADSVGYPRVRRALSEQISHVDPEPRRSGLERLSHWPDPTLVDWPKRFPSPTKTDPTRRVGPPSERRTDRIGEHSIPFAEPRLPIGPRLATSGAPATPPATQTSAGNRSGIHLIAAPPTPPSIQPRRSPRSLLLTEALGRIETLSRESLRPFEPVSLPKLPGPMVPLSEGLAGSNAFTTTVSSSGAGGSAAAVLTLAAWLIAYTWRRLQHEQLRRPSDAPPPVLVPPG